MIHTLDTYGRRVHPENRQSELNIPVLAFSGPFQYSFFFSAQQFSALEERLKFLPITGSVH